MSWFGNRSLASYIPAPQIMARAGRCACQIASGVKGGTHEPGGIEETYLPRNCQYSRGDRGRTDGVAICVINIEDVRGINISKCPLCGVSPRDGEPRAAGAAGGAGDDAPGDNHQGDRPRDNVAAGGPNSARQRTPDAAHQAQGRAVRDVGGARSARQAPAAATD